MGFFFEQELQAKKRSRQQRTTESLHRIGCTACPLNKAKVNTPKMQPSLADETLIYFLAEGPGRHEDEVSGKPLTGPSGKLLRHIIPEALIDYCSFDNCIRDRPPNNRDPDWVEIECCRSLVTKSIEQAKPKVIIGLGAFAQQWALGSSDQKGMRGRLFAVKIGGHSCWFMPTYHPARILHSANEQAKGQNKKNPSNDELLRTLYGRSFKLDLEKVFKLVEKLEPSIILSELDIRNSIATFAPGSIPSRSTIQLFELLEKAKKASVKAIDIETSTLRPFNTGSRILSVAISFDNTNFSFPLDHPKAVWSSSNKEQLEKHLWEILTDSTTKISHNAVFEIEWFAHYFGKEVVKHDVWQCTQLQAHFIDERRGAGQSDGDSKRATYQSLDFLVKMHFGISFKEKFKVDRKNMLQADLGEMLVYNAADTLLTLKLWGHQRSILSIEGLLNACDVAMPRQATVALMQYFGMPVNQVKVTELQRRLSDQIAVIEAEIEELDVVKQYIKDKPVKYKDNEKFNPLGDDALIIFRDYVKSKEILVEDTKKYKRGAKQSKSKVRTDLVTEDGKVLRWSIDKNVLDRIDHPLAKLIISLRNKTKMKSTYIDGLELGKGKYIYPDGKIHCNFNTTFTTTGRLSSDELNMQNFPQRNDAWVREQIEAPKGCVIVAADYGQLEMCGAAMCSKDSKLIKVLWDDYDTHMEWASKLAKLCPSRVGGDFKDKQVAKAFRSIVKNKLVFPAIYGATNKSIAGYLGIEEHYIDALMDEFWGTFSELKDWQAELLSQYRKYGYVKSPTGRRRHHPLTSNEAINSPIQCLASEIVVDAMCRLSIMAATTGKWHLHPLLNIHDDLSFIVPEKKLVSSIETIYKTMLTPTFGDVINVPLSVTISIGKDWFHREEVGKFWSHKDL